MSSASQEVLNRPYFESILKVAMKELESGFHLFVSLRAEGSQFIRFNGSKVRQIGTIADAQLELAIVHESEAGLRKATYSISLTGLSWEDTERVRAALATLRKEVVDLPVDPYAQLPRAGDDSTSEKRGKLLAPEEAAERILRSTTGLDLVGIYSSGPIVRAMANSAGQVHWFLTEGFSLDYSIYTPSQRAVKGLFAGDVWDDAKFAARLAIDSAKLETLERAPRKLERGSYRVYLAPSAVEDIVGMMNWGTVSEASIRQGESSLRLMRQGERTMSPKFSLAEDFSGGEIPRFNDEGELAALRLPIFERGKFVNSLVSARSAKEYDVPSTFATSGERMRSPVIAAGGLRAEDILKTLGTGIYLSNLHYLNWSDQPAGRITGMTRFACFWVENGKLVSPIENMRFDESLFQFFGEGLEDLTTEAEYLPSVGTYFARDVGGVRAPGMIVRSMAFTL